jgi:anti-sigma B factor antagonist
MNETIKRASWPQTKAASEGGRESALRLNLEIRVIEDVTVIRCKGRIAYRDEAVALSEKVAELLPGARQLVLELSAVEMIDGAGLGELVVIHRWARASNCPIKLAGPSNRMLELLELTNLVSVFEIYPALEDALLAFRGQMA